MTNETTTESPVQRLDIDPRELLLDLNIRTSAQLDKDFVASIKELGVIVPLIGVRAPGGKVRVRYGHRRTLAAIEAGLATVPVDVIGDEGTDNAAQIERILAQHAENTHRAGLSSRDVVGAVEQLSAFGMSPAQIVKTTRIKRDTVNAAKAVAQSELASKAAERYDFLTLEQAAAIAEFQDDPEAVKSLVTSAAPDPDDDDERTVRRRPFGGFQHTLEQLRQNRSEDEAIAKVEAELRAQGITVVKPPERDSTAMMLNRLRNRSRSSKLSDEGHASCPGHAVYVVADYEYVDDENDEMELVTEVVYVCTDPEGNGHLASAKAQGSNAKQTETAQDRADERATEERREVIANNKAWRSAETVRREWLQTFLARKTAPNGALAFIFGEMADPRSPLAGAQSRRHETACQLLGVEPPVQPWAREESEDETLTEVLAKASAGRAQVIALALALGAHEGILGVDTWRRASAENARYLTKLTEWGYQLSEIEQSVIDRAAEAAEDEDEAAES